MTPNKDGTLNAATIAGVMTTAKICGNIIWLQGFEVLSG